MQMVCREFDMSLTQVLEEHEGEVNSVVELRDGRLASCADDETVVVCELSTGECVQTLEGHEDYVYCAVELGDGRLASCSHDSSVRVWELSRGECVQTLERTCKLLLELQRTEKRAYRCVVWPVQGV